MLSSSTRGGEGHQTGSATYRHQGKTPARALLVDARGRSNQVTAVGRGHARAGKPGAGEIGPRASGPGSGKAEEAKRGVHLVGKIGREVMRSPEAAGQAAGELCDPNQQAL